MKFILLSLLLSSVTGSFAQGGIKSLKDIDRFLKLHTKYTDKAIDSNQTGTVIVAIKIERKEVKFITTIFAQNYQFEQEVKRVVQLSSGRWDMYEKETTVILTFNFSLEYECAVRPVQPTNITYEVNGLGDNKQNGIENAVFLKPILIKMMISCPHVFAPEKK